MDTDVSWERRVRERAYVIWEREGRPEGDPERHWARAEEELRAEEEERDRVEAAGAGATEVAADDTASGTAGTETWTGPGGSVGGEPREAGAGAGDQGGASTPAEGGAKVASKVGRRRAKG
jgi:hypothetical protein